MELKNILGRSEYALTRHSHTKPRRSTPAFSKNIGKVWQELPWSSNLLIPPH
jgi:hypothetical protein